MPIKFDKLFDLMREKGLTTYKIRKNKIISEGTLQKLREDVYKRQVQDRRGISGQ